MNPIIQLLSLAKPEKMKGREREREREKERKKTHKSAVKAVHLECCKVALPQSLAVLQKFGEPPLINLPAQPV